MAEDDKIQQMYNAIGNENLEERQKILEDYNEIRDNIQNLIDEAGEGGVAANTLKNNVTNVNAVFKGVLRAEEASLDAEILKVVSILGKSTIEKTQSGYLSFKPVEFAEKVNSHFGSLPASESDTPWHQLGFTLSQCYRTAYGLAPLYGALEWKKPETAKKERRAKDREEAVVQLKASSTQAGNETKEYKLEDVQRVYEALKKVYKENKEQPIIFYHFIIDPKSFSASVENMFHLSFLVRDGFADITLDKNEIPVVTPVSKSRKKRREESGELQSTCQAVGDLDLQVWKEFIKVLRIKKPMIPPAATPSTSKRQLSE